MKRMYTQEAPDITGFEIIITPFGCFLIDPNTVEDSDYNCEESQSTSLGEEELLFELWQLDLQ
ncbi:MAG: hypothetical protein PUF72_05560 [Clostridiales bacterium]|nr:hypothetical protein [Clostridiales bacterium]